MKTLQGHLLIATTDLRDPNFARTVILMVTHNKQGALGLVLNRPTGVPLKTAWEQVSQSPCELTTKILLGGPCQGPLMALHTQEALSDSEVLPGLYFTAKPEELNSLVAMLAVPQRYFVGYAGWGAGQIEKELEEGSWTITPADADVVFTPEETLDQLWDRVTKQVADARLVTELHIKHVPKDPTLN